MMKKIKIICFLLIIGGFSSAKAQHLKFNIDDENTSIKNAAGEKISVTTYRNLINTGNWWASLESKQKPSLRLRKITASEKQVASSIQKFMPDAEKIGKKAPPFELTDRKGNKITSENTKGKVVVLNFWFTQCKPCIKELPALNVLYETYKSNNNIVFAAITFDAETKVNSFLKRFPLNYPIATNAKKTCEKFNLKGYPTNIIIGRDGTIKSLIAGGIPQIGIILSKTIQQELAN